MVNKKYLIYETRKCVHNFQQFKTTRCYAKNIFAVDITLIDADNLKLYKVTKTQNQKIYREKKAKERYS